MGGGLTSPLRGGFQNNSERGFAGCILAARSLGRWTVRRRFRLSSPRARGRCRASSPGCRHLACFPQYPAVPNLHRAAGARAPQKRLLASRACGVVRLRTVFLVGLDALLSGFCKVRGQF